MPSDSMTPSSGGNDSAHPLSLDDAANLDFGDSSENTEEVVDAQQSNDEHVEATDDVDQETVEAADDNPETDENDNDAEDDGEGELSSTPEPADDATVTIDGKALTVAELKKGYFREADYTRRTQELATKRRDLEALSTRVTNSVNAIAELLTSTVPKRPDDALALTDPQRHYKEMTLHNSAMAKVAEVDANREQQQLQADLQTQLAEFDAETERQRQELIATAALEAQKQQLKREEMAVDVQMNREDIASRERIAAASREASIQQAQAASIGKALEKNEKAAEKAE